MKSSLPPCPLCGCNEVEVFDPRLGAGMGEPSLFCPQCLHHQLPARPPQASERTGPERVEQGVGPALLSFAGYAVPQRSGKLRRISAAVHAFCSGQFRLKVRIPHKKRHQPSAISHQPDGSLWLKAGG